MTGMQWLGVGMVALILFVSLGLLFMRRPKNWWQ